MKKLSALVLTLVAMLAMGGVAADAANKSKSKKVKSKVTLTFNAGPAGSTYYEEAAFTGKVTTKGKASKKAKKKCLKGRDVTIKEVGGGPFALEAHTKATKQGTFTLAASDAYSAPGQYKAVVEATKKGKFTCKRAASKAVSAF
jgi:hypothetical protein